MMARAAVPATSLIESGRVYAEIGEGRNTGIALVNPDMARQALMTFYFTDAEGNDFGEGLLAIVPGGQIAAFLNEAPFYGPSILNGTLTFNSSVPLSVIALEGITNQRSEFLTTTLPVVDLASLETKPILMPHFVAGGRWATDIILVNPTDDRISGVVQVMPATDPTRQTSETFYTIPARSSRKLRVGSQSSAIAGAFIVAPDTDTVAPSVTAIYTFTSGGVIVSGRLHRPPILLRIPRTRHSFRRSWMAAAITHKSLFSAGQKKNRLPAIFISSIRTGN